MQYTKTRTKKEIQSEIFSNKERIQKLSEKIQLLKELAGEQN